VQLLESLSYYYKSQVCTGRRKHVGEQTEMEYMIDPICGFYDNG